MNTITIDNFLTQEDFEKLSNVSLKQTESNQISVYHNQIDSKEAFEPIYL